MASKARKKAQDTTSLWIC